MSVILTVTPNPCVDKTIFIDRLEVGTFMRAEHYTCIAGGKGTNVSRAVRAMGRATRALVVVGGHTGAHVVEMIERDDEVECIPCWVASPTRTITTILEQPIHRQTALFEPGSRVTDAEVESIVGRFKTSLEGVKVATFNGTVCDHSIQVLYRILIEAAKDHGITTILDSHGPELMLGLQSAPYMVKPNVAEAEKLLGRDLATDAAKWDAVDEFHQAGVELVVLSLGARGVFVSKSGRRLHVVPPAVEEVNAVGSGDALVAGFAIGLMENAALEDMAQTAVAMGTANAMSWDIGHFTKREVAKLIPQVVVHDLR